MTNSLNLSIDPSNALNLVAIGAPSKKGPPLWKIVRIADALVNLEKVSTLSSTAKISRAGLEDAHEFGPRSSFTQIEEIRRSADRGFPT